MLKKAVKKLFGGIDLTWPKLIIFALAAAVVTAAFAIIPGLLYTSFHTIVTTMEVWILFGILIIMNSRSNLDSALKCFVFFLISQPLIYLLQVPFSWQGWGLFRYYGYWFVWTVLCFPMGFVGYYMKKGKWWGYLILLPMIIVTASSYYNYLSDFLYSYPRYILICLFCIGAMLLYPVAIFASKKIRIAGLSVSGVLIIAATVICLLDPPVYSTEIMSNGEEHPFDSTYTVSLEDPKYGDVAIRYVESIEDYMIHADFRRAGKTVLKLTSPDGKTVEYDLVIERTKYDITKR